MSKIYTEKEQIENIQQGNMGKEAEKRMIVHIAYMERRGLPPSLFKFLDDWKRDGR